MNSDGNGKEREDDPRREFRSVDDAYRFNITSGLYEPKSYAGQDTVDRKTPGTAKEYPLFTSASNNWLSIIFSISGLLVSILTLFLLFLTVYYAHKQWVEANQTAIAAEISARAAQDSVLKAQAAINQARDQFVKDRRPYIDQTSGVVNGPQTFSNPETSGLVQIVWNWDTTNYGKTPAAHIIPYAEMKLGSEPFVATYDAHGTQIGKAAKAYSEGGSQAPTARNFDTIFSRPMTESEAQSFINSRAGISIRIRITYQDLDRNRYESLICFIKAPGGAEAYCRGYVH